MNAPPTDSPADYVYDVTGALAVIPVCRSILYKEISNGNLRSFKLGRRRLIRASDLRAWVDGLAETS